MVGTTLKLRVDENAIEKHNQVQTKKLNIVTNEATTKRAALGDLQNRGVLRLLHGATKDATLQKDLKDVKPRVDTFWKKGGPLGVVASNNVAANKAPTTTNALTAATKPDGQRRMLLRSNSLRQGVATTNAGTAALGLTRQASTTLLPSSKTTTTTNVKVVDSKTLDKRKYRYKRPVNILQKTRNAITAAAAATKSKVTTTAAAESHVGSGGTTTLRREDSNLSRKSLTKLRAAIGAKPAVSQAGAAVKSQQIRKDVVPGSKVTTLPLAKTQPLKKLAAATTATESITTDTHSYKRLEGVEDIDADDKENLMLVSEFVNDIYDYLYDVESKIFVQKDHLDGQLEVNARMRAVLIDWINEVHMQFHLAAETFHMAVAIIDLYLQSVKDTKRLHLQLVGVTALFIATKYEELFPPALNDFVYITDDTYTARQICLMEIQILKTLDFTLSRPLPIHFLRRYSKAAGAEDAHHAMSKYFLELASIDCELASYKPSEIAASSIFLSLHLLNGNAKAGTGFNDKHWTKTLEFYSRYTADHLRPIAKKIASIARNAPQAKLQAVYNKYKSTKFQKIAMSSELYGQLMDSIINSKE